MFGVSLGIMDGAGGAAGGDFESIATATASGGETSFTISSIPQTYASLQLRCMLRRDTTGAANMGLRPNNETSASFYTQHYILGNGTTVTAAGTASGVFSRASNAIQVPGTTSGSYSAQVWDIQDYTSTTRNKTLRTFSGFDANGSGQVGLNSNLFIKTDAITSLVVFFGGDAVDANSVFSLYGIKGD